MPFSLTAFNPYHDQTFFDFILLFLKRMGLFITGQLPIQQLASDEIQVLVLIGIAISSSFVGVFLVLRKMTMLANSLSHTILLGIVLAYFFTSEHEPEHGSMILPMQAMLFAALIMGLLTAFLTEFLCKTVKLQEDASTGLVFTGLFALGVVLVTVLTRSAHIGTEAVMGNADALHPNDLFWVYVIAVINVFLIFCFYKEYKITTFDPSLAAAMGLSPLFYNYLLMSQVSATTITSFRAVGVLLVLAFMTAPPLATRLLTHRLKNLLIGAAALGSLCSLVGVALTRHLLTSYSLALSTTGVVVCTLMAFYFIALVMKTAMVRIRTKAYLSD